MRAVTLTVLILAFLGFARADNTDPEPPGGAPSLNKLKGKWTSVRRISGGVESPYMGRVIYTFDGNKGTYTTSKGKKSYALKLEVDKNRPFSLKMERENAKGPQNYFYKIEKGELFLTIDRTNDPKARPDFSGKTIPVLIYKQEK